MLNKLKTDFATINPGFAKTFKAGRLTLGLVVPLERYDQSATPTMEHHIERAKLADDLGFAALWLRDVPFNVPTFGDAGQMFDPFVYLGVLASVTQRIALGTASIILPLRHPAHVAKAAATVDVLSGGRLLLGVASGDRPEEYPALNMDYADRGDRFCSSLNYIRAVGSDYPHHAGVQGSLSGHMDMLPKPHGSHLPLLITGGSQQTPDWVAQNGDGWMTYPRDAASQGRVIADYRNRLAAAGERDKPVMQSLYVDVLDKADAPPRPIHLGFASGVDYLRNYLQEIEALGVNHVALNLRFNTAPIESTLDHLATALLPDFS